MDNTAPAQVLWTQKIYKEIQWNSYLLNHVNVKQFLRRTPEFFPLLCILKYRTLHSSIL